MYCFDQGQRHVTEQDPVMTAKQFMFEESQDHMSQLLASPSWSTFPCQQHSNEEKIRRVKNGQFACMRINCCLLLFPWLFLWHFPVLASDLFVFFPSSRDLNVCLPYSLLFHKTWTWPDLNQISKNNTVATAQLLSASKVLSIPQSFEDTVHLLRIWVKKFHHTPSHIYIYAGKATEYFLDLLYGFQKSGENKPSSKTSPCHMVHLQYGTLLSWVH